MSVWYITRTQEEPPVLKGSYPQPLPVQKAELEGIPVRGDKLKF